MGCNNKCEKQTVKLLEGKIQYIYDLSVKRKDFLNKTHTLTINEKIGNFYHVKIGKVHQKIPLREQKDKPQSGRGCLQHT